MPILVFLPIFYGDYQGKIHEQSLSSSEPFILHIENNFKLNISTVSILRYFIIQTHSLLLHLGHISGFGYKIWLQIYITVKKSWKTCEQLCLRSSGISVHAPDVLLELLNFSDNYSLLWMWDFQYTTEISGKCIRDINELLHTKKNLPHLQQ